MQADVYYMDAKSGEKKPLGKTPLKMPSSSLKDVIGDRVASGQYFTIEVEKKGYRTEKLLVPATRFGTLVTSLDVKLDKTKQGDEKKQEETARQILDHLFLAQKLALARQFERAQIELDQVLALAPDFPRALSMRGSIYFAQKNYGESLKWYERALAADPQMDDVVQMIAKVRALQGDTRTPAGSARQ